MDTWSGDRIVQSVQAGEDERRSGKPLVTLDDALAAREKRLRRLKLYAVALVQSEWPQGLPLGELLEEMQRVERSDEAISEALASLQSLGELRLTVDRRMVIPANAP